MMTAFHLVEERLGLGNALCAVSLTATQRYPETVTAKDS